MFIFSLSSFFYFTQRSYPIDAIDDGSLTTADKQKLHRLFDITIVSKERSVARVKKVISQKKYPDLYAYRFEQPDAFSKVKFDALFCCPFSRIICLDSDVLFFAPPARLLKWLDRKEQKVLYNYHNWQKVDDAQLPDMEHAFRELLKRYLKKKFTFISTFNAGLFCLPNKQVLNLTKINELFKLFNALSYSRYSIVDETTLGCLLTHPKVGEALDSDAYVVAPFLIDYPATKTAKLRAIHYAAESKGLFAADALQVAVATNFFHKAL